MLKLGSYPPQKIQSSHLNLRLFSHATQLRLIDMLRLSQTNDTAGCTLAQNHRDKQKLSLFT